MSLKSLCFKKTGSSQLFTVCVSVPRWPVCIIIYLEAFIGNCQVLDHPDNISRSFSSSELPPLLLIALHILTWSAYRKINYTRLGRSFTLNRINTGSKALPWDTPVSAIYQLDEFEFNRTICWPITTKSFIHVNKLPLILILLDLYSGWFWGTLSKASLKSTKATSTGNFWYLRVHQISRATKKLVSHE